MNRNLCLLTILHFLVDGSCGAALAAYALQEPRLSPIIFHFGLYTLLAFGGQGPIGWFLDCYPKYLRQLLISSGVFLALGSLSGLGISLQAILLGLGNCFFHIVGGFYVLKQYQTFSQLGLFVSSGALGLGLGLNSMVGTGVFVPATLLTILLLITSLDIGLDFKNVSALEQLKPCVKHSELLGCAFVLLFCILLRGFSSSGIGFSAIMALPCTLALGKLMGGIFCDWLGYKRTILLIFLLGFICLQLQGDYATMAFVFVCNMTMPLTLRLLHWCRPTAPGLMFGLAATCLFPGSLYRGILNLPAQAVLVLQFLSLALAGYYLLVEEESHV